MRFFYSLAMLLFLFLAILHFAGCGVLPPATPSVFRDGGACKLGYWQAGDYCVPPTYLECADTDGGEAGFACPSTDACEDFSPYESGFYCVPAAH